MKDYKKIARDARKTVLRLIYSAQVSHIGSNLSAIDILTVLFHKADTKKDEVILSAGWKAAAWYYFLHKKGIITEKELNSFCQPGSKFIGLVEPQQGRWGLRCAGGSMGWGAAMSVGIATANKVLNKSGEIYTIISDGELQTETMAATARNASKRKLDNLIFILDNNSFCAMGKTKEILDVDPKILFYDWNIYEIDGHSFKEIEDTIEIIKKPIFVYSKEGIKRFDREAPHLIIANTIKGKGIPKWENNNLWHYAQIKEEDYKYALSCLN